VADAFFVSWDEKCFGQKVELKTVKVVRAGPVDWLVGWLVGWLDALPSLKLTYRT